MSAGPEQYRYAEPTPGRYVVDPKESWVGLRTRSVLGLLPVSGRLAIGEGVLNVAAPSEDSTVEVSVLSSSFDTSHAKRDAHVRSADYLDAAAHPALVFRGTGVRRDALGTAVLTGELTVRGRSAPVDVTVESVREEGRRLTARGTARVDRYAFGITTAKGMTGRWTHLRLEVVAHR